MTASARPLVQADRPNVIVRPAGAKTWAGRILSGLVVTFLVFDAGLKVLRAPPAMELSRQLGCSESTVVTIGAILLACVAAYAIPRTAIVGAVLLTGYFGGAVCTQLHARAGAFPIFFAVLIGALVWLGLFLRDERARALLLPRGGA